MSVYILSTSERITLFWQRFLSGIGFYIPHFWTAFFTPTFHSLFDRRLQIRTGIFHDAFHHPFFVGATDAAKMLFKQIMALQLYVPEDVDEAVTVYMDNIEVFTLFDDTYIDREFMEW